MHIPTLSAARALALALLGTTASAWAPVYAANPAASGAPYCPPRPATTEQQRAIFNEFIQTFLVEKNATKALLDHMSEDYIQHNPSVLSGRQTAVAALSAVPPTAVNYTILARAFDADRGWVHYRMDAQGAPQPSAVVDIFRFEGTCIREHWDVIQQRPANATNPLALF